MSASEKAEEQKLEEILRPVLEKMTTSIIKDKPENLVKYFLFMYNNLATLYVEFPTKNRKLYNYRFNC